MPDIIVPVIKQDERLNPTWQQEWYKRQEDRWNPPFVIDSIHFTNPDHYLAKRFSIRAARDWTHDPFWFYVAMLFFISQLTWTGFGVSLKLLTPFIPHLPSLS